MTLRLAAAATLLAVAVLPAAAASRVVPAQPTTFQPVNLQMTVDSCTFIPASVLVRMEANLIKVTQLVNNCLVPGEAQVVDVRLGSLPAGQYRVEVYLSSDSNATPVESLAFTVAHGVEIAISPPIPRPLTDYTGLWWTASEGGWGLSLHQGLFTSLFGTWYVYGSNGQPEWYTLQGGQWTSSTRWTGTLYRTTGPFFGGPGFDPRLVLVQPAGTAVLDFTQAPGTIGQARFTYTINGAATTKVITRFTF
jgi:hypothetical protein